MVLKHLASGGMADVLLGRADGIEGFERHVVLKRIRPEHARDQRFIRMFVDEARLAANLHHQHIVQVHDVGESHGEYFIAMEYIHGEDVRTILSNASKARAHVPLGYAIAIVSAAAAGLHYAHERRGSDKRPLGIVHRDISPANILVGYDGSVKVVDFGIAKAAMRKETRSGNLKGKVSYMSPEQCTGDEIDRRSDVYSLGVVLYELATTTRLFKGDNDYLVMDEIVNGRVSLPRVRRPDLPNELSAIIMQAIAPDPERRYFSADELRFALDQFAGKAGLIASTSAVAAYMRKQFGDRPEPWLELGGELSDSLEAPAGSSPAVHGWIEIVRSDDSALRNSGGIPRTSSSIRATGSAPVRVTGSVPVRATGSVPATEAGTAPGERMPDAGSHSRLQRMPVMRLPSSQSPTDSRMGWESRQLARASRGLTATKVAMFSAPLIALLGVAIWWLAGSGDTTSPTAALATRPHAQPMEPAVVASPPPDPVKPAQVPTQIAPAPGAKLVELPPESAVPPPKRTHRSSSPRIADASQATPAPSPKPAPRAPPPASSAPVAVAPSPAATTPSPATTTPSPAATTPSPAALPGSSAAPVPGPAAPAAPAIAVAPSPPVAVDPGVPQLSHAVVDRIASDHARELSRCDGGEELHGEITVKFTVDVSGKVTKAQVATGIRKPQVAGCILRLIQKWQFPRQGPTGALGTYTLVFQ